MNRVEVWVQERSAPGASGERLETLLTAAERSRRDRYRRPEDQDRFGLGRALCRTILGLRLGRPPSSIELEVGPLGRPVLANAPQGPWFSISHSGELVVVALAPTPHVGVDVEREDRAIAVQDLAGRVCTPAEQAALAARPVRDQPRRFCEMWTLKEAYAKATGLGLRLDPARLGFDLERPGYVQELGELSAAETAAWRFRLWRPAEGYSLALAFKPAAGCELEIHGPLSAVGLLGA